MQSRPIEIRTSFSSSTGVFCVMSQSPIGDWLITQKTPVDEEKDVRISIGRDCIYRSSRTDMDGSLDSAISAFAAANNGRMPKDIYDLRPYVSSSEQEALKKRIRFNPTNFPPNSVPILNP